MEMLRIQPQHYERMGGILQEYFQELSRHEEQLLREKLLVDGVMDGETYEEAFTEFKKFVALSRISGKGLGMTKSLVDEVWHQYILFTPEYHAFCQKFYGSYFHHVPNVPSRRGMLGALEALVKEYREMFGNMPKIWDVEVEHEPRETRQA